MEHGLPLINITLVAVTAAIMGMFMVRLRQPAVIGYIILGAALGTMGLFSEAGERAFIFNLAEVGVILLLYFIGMELSVRNLRDIWKVSLFTLMGQVFFGFAISISLSMFFDWETKTMILFAFCLALSSTAVAVKTLESYDETKSHVGKLTIGILIAQDLAVAPMLLIISGLQSDSVSAGIGTGAIITIATEVLLSVAILGFVIFLLTRRKTINLPFHKVWAGKQELTSLWALAFCFLMATLCGLIGLSAAFGAFLAGLIVGNSAQHTQLHRDSAPIQSVLLMVFFLSVGLLLDFAYILDNLGLLLVLWILVMFSKTLLNSLLLRVQGESWANSIRCSLILGQLGEFSFVLAATALTVNAIDSEFHKMIIALTVISLVSTPFYNDIARRLGYRAIRHLGNPRLLFATLYAPEWRITKRWLARISLHENKFAKDTPETSGGTLLIEFIKSIHPAAIRRLIRMRLHKLMKFFSNK